MDVIRTVRFGDLLRQHRLAAGLTQEALAARAGLSVRAIADLERGARRTPYRDTVRMLAGALALGESDRDALEVSARRPRGRDVTRPADVWPLALLPTPPTSLLGREQEVATTVRLLRRTDVRLLTLTGPGGAGKTRIALQVAAEVNDDFVDGVAFIGLASVEDAGRVVPAVLDSLGLTAADGQSAFGVVADHLHHKHLLLVLDTFEHLLPAAPEIARLLERCPRLVILATSRAALHLSGEHEFLVSPFAVPPGGNWGADAGLEPEQLLEYVAVRLFCQRAESVQPAFALRPENASAVAEITRRLDGLPLAIELAAARSKLLPPEAMLARLQPCLSLLTDGACDLPPRQRTLRDTIGWSYGLLDQNAQRLFRRLSVVGGGWTLGAVEAVCGDWERSAGDLLDDLSLLVNMNLVQRRDGASGEPRFSMLGTVREFGREQLEAFGEWEAVAGALGAPVVPVAIGR